VQSGIVVTDPEALSVSRTDDRIRGGGSSSLSQRQAIYQTLRQSLTVFCTREKRVTGGVSHGRYHSVISPWPMSPDDVSCAVCRTARLGMTSTSLWAFLPCKQPTTFEGNAPPNAPISTLCVRQTRRDLTSTCYLSALPLPSHSLI
jgi:hypothetical protein